MHPATPRTELSLSRRLMYFAYIAFLRHTPEDYRPYALFFPALRSWLVRGFAERCGERPRVKSGGDFSPAIRIGDRTELGTRCLIQGGAVLGSDIIMGPDVKIYTRNHEFGDTARPIRDQGKRFAETRIGDDVWLGANVVVLPGVSIGDHSVVAAGAIVTRDVPPWSIAAGNPARVIRSRHGEAPVDG